MSIFIDDTIPILEVDQEHLLAILKRLSALWPSEIACSDKEVGVENYTCRSLVRPSREVREKFEDQDWGDDEEIAGIAMDFLGMAIKSASRYLQLVHISELDLDMVASNIRSRDDVLVR